MALWRLTPREPLNLDGWRGSNYWGSVVIRAADETAAREIAQSAFEFAAIDHSPLEVRVRPWLQDRFVACTRVLATTELVDDGAQGVVAPHQAVSRARVTVRASATRK